MSQSELPQLGSLAERLAFATRDRQVHEAVSKALGRNPVTLKRYISGQSTIPADVVTVVAQVTNLSPEWLLSGILSDRKVVGADENVVQVRRLEVRASAGSGRAVLPPDDLGGYIPFQRAWLRSLGVSAEDAEFLQAEGDSMEPTIKDRDLMLVDRGFGRVANGKIYVMVRDGLVIVKRVQLLAYGGLTLISDNERYPDETIRREDIEGLNIEARVAWYGRAI